MKTETTLPIALSLPAAQPVFAQTEIEPVACTKSLPTNTHLEILKGVFAPVLSSFAMLSRIIPTFRSMFSTESASFFAKRSHNHNHRLYSKKDIIGRILFLIPTNDLNEGAEEGHLKYTQNKKEAKNVLLLYR